MASVARRGRWPSWVCACVSGTNLSSALEAQRAVRYCLNCLDHSFSHHAEQRLLPDQPDSRPLPTIPRQAVTPQRPLQPRHVPSRGRLLCAPSAPPMSFHQLRWRNLGHLRPGDARHLVGQRHRYQPDRTALQDPSGPNPGGAVPSWSAMNHRGGSQHQQSAYLPVARLGDPTKADFAARRVLTWHKAKPGGKVSRALEDADVGDRRRDQGCGDRTDAGDCGQTACCLIVPRVDDDGHSAKSRLVVSTTEVRS